MARDRDKAPPPDEAQDVGAPSPVEGEPPPGTPPVETEAEPSMAELRDQAKQLGVMPDEGSGSGGAVVKADIVQALESVPEPPAGRPPLSAVAEKAAEHIVRED